MDYAFVIVQKVSIGGKIHFSLVESIESLCISFLEYIMTSITGSIAIKN